MVLIVLKKLLFLFLLYSYVNAVWATPASAKTSTKTSSHSNTAKSVPRSNPQANTYRLNKEYNATNFFDEFGFFTAPDPSHGAVNYQTKQNALGLGLADTKVVSIPGLSGQKLRVVHLAAQSGAISSSSSGRPSVRLTSHQEFTRGLFIADFTHLPVAECGIWPAL